MSTVELRLLRGCAALGLLASLGWQAAYAQSLGATFGEVIRLSGTPSDIVLDESRTRLYLVNTNANRVDIYDYKAKALAGSIPVGNTPLAAAMSMENAWLYVTNNGSATLSVIDLGSNSVVQTVTLAARPEGVAVGNDGRVLITTQGTGSGNQFNTLLLFDRTQQLSMQVQPVQVPPPPPTPTPLPAVMAGRPFTTFRGKLATTPDGQFIIGMSVWNNFNNTYLFLYEVVSGTILKTRSVGGQSTVISMAPDGSRFMAGFTLYDTATLNMIGQQNAANAPFPMYTTTGQSSSFNAVQNIGGSAFSPDSEILYSAFNVAVFSLPAPRPQSSTLLISNSRNLFIRLGIKMPESIIAKMVVTSDGAQAWGLSESGLLYLPLSRLYDYPILAPETTQVFLAVDQCNQGLAQGTLRINNLGKGKLTFSVPALGNSVIAQASSGVAPATITFTMEPGRFNISRQPGTNLWSGNSGSPLQVNLVSPEAINIPNTIRLYMNYRQSDQRGVIYPVPTVPNSNSEGLQDLVLDETRGVLYVTNSGFNRIELFDIKKQKFLDPIEVGQLPHQMAMSLDGSSLYVGNTGGESIGIVDLDQRKVVGQVEFPPIPRNATAGIVSPRTLAMGLSGLQVIMSNGGQWKLVGNLAVPRPNNPNIFSSGANLSSPQQMIASPGGEYILTLNGSGVVYLYDALIDTYTISRQVYTPNQPIISYYGPLAAAPGGAYHLANGLIMSSALAVIGGAERPGQVVYGPAPAPGLPATQTIVSAGLRNVASLFAVDDNIFVRLTTAVRQNATAATRDDVRPTLEAVDIRTGAESLVGVAAENPIISVFGQSRANIPPRQLVVDSAGNAYAITLSGLSVIPLTPSGSGSRPQITGGSRGIVNSTDGTPNFRPGSFITVNGTNLAFAASADQIPLPSVLGGSCVTFSDVPIRLMQTSARQVSGQLPEDLRPGVYVAQVRSLATAQTSDPVVVTVQKPQ
jgi:YVTN family beta-propeller protein